MMEPGSSRAPEGVTVDDVDWLPSGARSGIVRVQGRRPPGFDAALPTLVVGRAGDERRFQSLPDTATAGPDGWRGVYVVEAELALAADELRLEWPAGGRAALPSLAPATAEPAPRLAVVEDDTAPVDAASEPPVAEGGEVVDRAVLAERRASRAEAALDRQAEAARNALAAVEALELRSAALAHDLEAVRAERDTLRERVQPGEPAGPTTRETALERALADREAEAQALRAALADRDAAPPAPDEEAERRAAALTQALTEAVAEVDGLRAELHEQLVLRRTRDVESAADRVALVALVQELDGLRAAADAARAEAAVIVAERDAVRVALEQQRAETAGANAAHDETRRRFTERVAELRVARDAIARLETELATVRLDARQAAADHARELEDVRERAARDAQVAAERLASAQARAERLEADAAEVPRLRAELARAEANLRRAETAREAAVASALAATAQRRAAAVRDADHAPERVAALESELVTLRAELAQRPAPEPSPDTPPVVAPADLIARAAEQVRAAAAHREAAPSAGRRLMADLDAAAAALRAAAGPPPADPAPDEDVAGEPEGAGLAGRSPLGAGLAAAPAPSPGADETPGAAADRLDAVAPDPPSTDAQAAATGAVDPVAPAPSSTDAPESEGRGGDAAAPEASAADAPAPAGSHVDPSAPDSSTDVATQRGAPAAPDRAMPGDEAAPASAGAIAAPGGVPALVPPPGIDLPDVAAGPERSDSPAAPANAEPPSADTAVAPVDATASDRSDVPAAPADAEPPTVAAHGDDPEPPSPADTTVPDDDGAPPADPPPIPAPAIDGLGGSTTWDAPVPTTDEAAPARRQITSEFSELPSHLARGRGRTYPPLRGGLARLAHDDPAAAARLLAGLVPALHRLAPGTPPTDLTLTELDGTLALDAGTDATAVEHVSAPRGRRAARIDLRTDAVTLAEAVAGVGPVPRRRGPLRAARGRRRARALLAQAAEAPPSLAELVTAGARPDPLLALRAFAYAIPRAWTRGHAFTVEVRCGDEVVCLVVRDDASVETCPETPAPDATLTLDDATLHALLTGAASPALDGPQLSVVRDWAVRLGALPA